MLRNGVLVVALLFLFSGISFAVVDSNNEISKKFSEAQRLATQGQVMQAITAYQALILSNPQLPEAYNNLAALYLQQNKTKQAKHILEQGLHAHKSYGVLYESLTAINVAMAREAYSKALQIELEPSAIRIASLSLANSKSQAEQNTIVISKIDNPVVEEKQVTEPIIIPKVKPVSKIKQVSITASKIKNTQSSIEKVLQAWSSAWSAQAVDMYLSFYHNQYRPSNGMSRKGWVQSRRYRLKKPQWIKIGLSDFKIKKQTGTQAVVNFKQLYQSNSFRDVSYKQVVLLNTDDGWRIFREKSF
ncbi:MAG: tetratricopeptide repeat protein [Gammaproteobacteria bacterium]|nr:tetratricopeptide repeat protein [Gammaproteobacteria bacterium]